ncbi:MAG: two-component system, OmpR family, sensor kinase [Solirubrobacteraceae bacterium]|nr:two-component system, OmpR family, sensor kinase [Solirubrobacteraceae bacterium]
MPGSIRWRFAGWVAGVVIGVSAVTFVVVYRETGSELRREIDRDVTGDVTGLLQTLRGLPPGSPKSVLAASARYVQSQPFKATSSLIFVIVPGGGTLSNHPEVFGGGTPDDGEGASEQAAENRLGRDLLVEHDGFSTRVLPDVGAMRLAERPVEIAGMRVVAGAGEPLVTVTRAERGIAGAFVVAGAVALGLALIASYLAGAVFSRPLRRMASVAARVDDGELAPRMTLSGRPSREVRVLTESFNHMLDRLAAAFGRQREFIADASHELRTPLTVIAGQLEVLAETDDPSREEIRRVERLVTGEVARTARLVDDLLVLAQSDRGDFIHTDELDLQAFVGELWESVGHLAERSYELGPVPPGRLRADPDRLAQAVRNLVGNAIDHTSRPAGRIRLDVVGLQERVVFVVADDGPGIPAAEREQVFERFYRVDAGRSRAHGGSGLGLAIVRAIADAHHGAVSAGASELLGGAELRLELPAWRPAA